MAATSGSAQLGPPVNGVNVHERLFILLKCNGCDVCEVKVEDSVTSKETKKKESNCF